MDVITRYFCEGAARIPREGRRATPATVVTPVRDESVPAGGFRVHYREDEVLVEHSDAAGLQAGLDMVEVLAEDESFTQALEVADAPLMETRSYLLDVSGDRIPTWDSFVRLVDVMERLRLNQLELRVGHAFTYVGHEDVWEGTSPLTAGQLKRLASLCDAHGVHLVCAIEPLTHWERWLALPAYRNRAELPDGRVDDRGEHHPPSELAATPSNAHFAGGLVAELLHAQGSGLLNVGGHATTELGLGRSMARVERRGLAEVYLDYLEHATEAVGSAGAVAEMWADLFVVRPDLIERLPDHVVPYVRCSVPPGEGRGGFGAAGSPLVGTHRPFGVAPGTGTWNTFCGRLAATRANIGDAVEWGVAHGATGLLLTEWAGHGHWAPRALCLPALVEAAVRAWRGQGPGEAMEMLLAALVPADVAGAVLVLGTLPEKVPVPTRNTDITWESLSLGGHLPPEWEITRRMVEDGRGVLADAERMLRSSTSGAGALQRNAVHLCADMSSFALTLIEVDRGWSRATRSDLARRWAELRRRQRAVWLAAARPGGLEHSLSLLDPVPDPD